MEKPITLTLHLKDGDKTFTAKRVPLQTSIDAADMLEQLGDMTVFSWAKAISTKAKFVAGLFDDKEVTQKAILDGMYYSEQFELDEILSTIITGEPKN
ncbi:hypothetical protein PQ472_07710 [Lacticaseibacillus pabuli]|uniref:Tail assembly chaperone E/41/14-like protein n=1 Tax=Lacticaseibacillus pabuli TaxID=3025672 RepID=A0ABY7WNN5_9LACO|nr:hypothetical protein [Lacticaseibacillus sp. KACC 23028]WDF81810.1 hypothetical protein PQ472_07710 [Lacticaseibacillus sp. KACC 23028]